MRSRRSSLAGLPHWASITAVLVILAPGTVFATHFELSRLANEVELISAQLADDLRYTRHYSSVRQRAVTLRREASQLADSLRRNRSNSRIRSQFKDVRRGYERLEQAFFTADRRDHVPRLYREINLLSNVFASLSDEFYYAGLGGQSYGPVYDSRYSGIAIIGSRSYGSGSYGSRSYGSSNYGSSNYGSNNYGSRNSGSRDIDSRRDRSRDYDRRDHSSRSNGRIEPNRERAVPSVFRGANGRSVPSRQGDREGRGERAVSGDRDRPGRAGLDRGSRGVPNARSFDHGSRVLERQDRQNTARRELESRARNNRPAATARQSSRGSDVQRGRGSRGAVSEGRRRNPY